MQVPVLVSHWQYYAYIQQSWEMEMVERVQNVNKRNHKQMWLLLRTYPSPLQDVASFEGTMTSATIQNAPQVAAMVGKRNRQHSVLMEQSVLSEVKLPLQVLFVTVGFYCVDKLEDPPKASSIFFSGLPSRVH